MWLFWVEYLRFGASDDRRVRFYQCLNRSIVSKGWANGDYEVKPSGTGEILQRLQCRLGSAPFESSDG
jgi:hypothetical protein